MSTLLRINRHLSFVELYAGPSPPLLLGVDSLSLLRHLSFESLADIFAIY